MLRVRSTQRLLDGKSTGLWEDCWLRPFPTLRYRRHHTLQKGCTRTLVGNFQWAHAWRLVAWPAGCRVRMGSSKFPDLHSHTISAWLRYQSRRYSELPRILGFVMCVMNFAERDIVLFRLNISNISFFRRENTSSTRIVLVCSNAEVVQIQRWIHWGQPVYDVPFYCQYCQKILFIQCEIINGKFLTVPLCTVHYPHAAMILERYK